VCRQGIDRFFRPIRRFIHVDDEPRLKNKFAPPRLQKQSSYVNEDLQKITQYYPELVNFMASVARESAPDESYVRASRLYRAREVQNDYKWEIGFMYMGDYKYCERIKRHHRNNNI
jgi:hypothetical protein